MAYSDINVEPDWPFAPADHVSSTGPIQESDLFKHFLLDIGNWGLNYAYHKYYLKEKAINKYKHTKTKHPSNIIIIGGGTSGLVAGYELAQVGHHVTILEMQHGVGGRVKTIRDSHFYSGQWADCKYEHIYTQTLYK